MAKLTLPMLKAEDYKLVRIREVPDLEAHLPRPPLPGDAPAAAADDETEAASGPPDAAPQKSGRRGLNGDAQRPDPRPPGRGGRKGNR